MDSDEARMRLLAIARDRLSKLPGAYRKFEGELADWRGCALLASAQTMPLGYEEGERLGHPGATAAIQSHMLSVVDRWAIAQSKPPGVSPLGAVPTPIAANLPVVGANSFKANSPSLEPRQRSAAQDAAIVAQLVASGYDPQALPKNLPGKPGVKAATRTALGHSRMWSGTTVFDKAWERLQKHGEIAYRS